MTPNLFQFATKELSQDAFLCWFISWSDLKLEAKNPKLHLQSKDFISNILKNNKLKLPKNYEIEVKTQYKNIDILVKIKTKPKNIILMIEDKVSSGEHSNQLTRYKKIIEEKFKEYDHVFSYIKSDLVFVNEINKVKASGYYLIDINGLSDLIKNEDINNDIFNDFKNHLEKKVNGYDIYTPYDQWGKSQWYSLVHKLNCKLPDTRFGRYHLGSIWWLIIEKTKLDDKKNIDISLEITNKNKLFIKIHSNKGILNKKIQEEIIKNIIPSIKKHGAIKSKNIRGTKTRAIIEFPNFVKLDENGVINLKETILFISLVKKSFNNYLLSL